MRTGDLPLVLCYHAVTDRWPHELALPARTIVAQVERLLTRGYRPATAAEVVERGGRLLHVTFDDAFRSVHGVLPELDRLGVPVTLFACTSYLEDGRPLDVPELARHAKQLPSELATMDWDALRSVLRDDVEIGSHTVTHPHLTRLTDAALELELQQSRAALEARLGQRCRFLAYPYGEEDERVRRAARAAGYEAAFAIKSDELNVDRFAVPRVCLFRSDNRVRAALKTRPLLRRAVRKLSRA